MNPLSASPASTGRWGERKLSSALNGFAVKADVSELLNLKPIELL